MLHRADPELRRGDQRDELLDHRRLADSGHTDERDDERPRGPGRRR
jgi:hypothetical protein